MQSSHSSGKLDIIVIMFTLFQDRKRALPRFRNFLISGW